MNQALCLLALIIALGILVFIIWIGWATYHELDAFDHGEDE